MFPAEVVPVSIFLSSLIHHLIALALVVIATALVFNSVSPMILLLPVYMLFVGLLAVGVGWIVSSLHVYLRDTAQVLAVVMTLWFWATPIMITEKQIPGGFSSWCVESHVMGGARLSRPPVVRALAQLAGVRGAGGLFGDRIRAGRAVLPPSEARLCRRALAGART